MHWLLHGDEKAGRQKDKLQPDGMRTHIDELAAESNGRIAVQPMPSSVPAATLSAGVDKQGLDTSEARTATAHLPRGGGQYSFSGLRGEHRDVLPARGADDEAAAASPPAAVATPVGGRSDEGRGGKRWVRTV